ncbi:Oidioi.mRNA.OKI2018_I69.PAR.g8523.t1.cds [Oikopleura dioica]|uniref:Oidioi.mRNA.OKI2018_I69.PAR.g8523.t1.cds n=1 Tax=Oikopleura dioica TaxID=34765 RepID=A0ABN7RIW0_OIKDI|nr:Oidioi.mRNA.OKI2018_I69.PAR.g8523.t1.cds [Oikopleura dioica]
MRFLSIFIFFEGVFRANCSFRARPSIENRSAIVAKEDKCPDEHLQIECESICRLEFNRCRLLCETEYCQSICDREYDNCRNGCPCGADCKEGCNNCENTLCPVGILVIGADVNEAFSISFDGQTSTKATISAPRDDYLELAPHALIKNELYIFGGQNTMKIAKLVGCEWIEQVPKLINPMKQESAALTIDNGTKALICFQYTVFAKKDKTLEKKKENIMKIFATLAASASAFGPQFPSEASNSQFYLNAVSQALTAAQNQGDLHGRGISGVTSVRCNRMADIRGSGRGEVHVKHCNVHWESLGWGRVYDCVSAMEVSACSYCRMAPTADNFRTSCQEQP